MHTKINFERLIKIVLVTAFVTPLIAVFMVGAVFLNLSSAKFWMQPAALDSSITVAPSIQINYPTSVTTWSRYASYIVDWNVSGYIDPNQKASASLICQYKGDNKDAIISTVDNSRIAKAESITYAIRPFIIPVWCSTDTHCNSTATIEDFDNCYVSISVGSPAGIITGNSSRFKLVSGSTRPAGNPMTIVSPKMGDNWGKNDLNVVTWKNNTVLHQPVLMMIQNVSTKTQAMLQDQDGNGLFDPRNFSLYPVTYSVKISPDSLPFITPGKYVLTLQDEYLDAFAVSAPFSINNGKSCALCLYQDFPQCSSVATSLVCAATKDPATGFSECAWNMAQNKCISRFEDQCRTEEGGNSFNIFSVKADPYLSSSGRKKADLDAKLSLIKDFIHQNTCGSLKFFENGHGKESDCSGSLTSTVEACTACNGNCTIIKDSCSTFQNQNAVATLAKNIQKSLCAKKDKTTTVTVTANQAIASESCMTPETITITCDKISTSYFNCNNLPTTCSSDYGLYELLLCSSYNSKNVYQKDLQYICCPDAKWYPAKVSGDYRLCPGDKVVKGTAKGQNKDNDTAFETFSDALLLAENNCYQGVKNVFTPGKLQAGLKNGIYNYSQDWECLNRKPAAPVLK